MYKPYSQSVNLQYSQQGVTMIEAMISILLFAIGALGLVALQYSSIVGTGDNQQRTVAIWKAQELANRIKSNPSEILTYESTINNTTLDSIGKDRSHADDGGSKIIACGTGSYVTPSKKCLAGVECSDIEKVAFDVWDVFCEPTTGVAVTGSTGNNAAAGSAALTELELGLMEHADGSGDYAIYMEWLSREGEQVKGEDSAEMVPAELCGSTEQIDSRLDVYCLRFRP